MIRMRHLLTMQLMASLLMAVMLLVHITKVFHFHSVDNHNRLNKRENGINKATAFHGSCSICEFQLAKEIPFTGEIQLLIATVYPALTYSRLLASLNTNSLLIAEGRGPPKV